MAEFWRALRTLKALQAEQARAQASAHVLEGRTRPDLLPLEPDQVDQAIERMLPELGPETAL